MSNIDKRIGRRWIAGALVVGSVAVSTGCQGSLRAGNRALESEDYTKAESSARLGLAKHGSDPDYNLLMAQALAGQERWGDAKPYAKRAFEYEGFEASAGRVYGKILWEMERPIEAVAAWRVAREFEAGSVSDEDYVRALEMAIAEAEDQREYGTSLRLREELGQVSPDHALAGRDEVLQAKERQAEALQLDNDYEAAITILAELEEKRPDNEKYPLQRGSLLATLGRDDEAAKAFDRYVELGSDADRVARLTKVAGEAEQLGAYGVAAQFLERAVKAAGPNPTSERVVLRSKLASLLLSSGRSKEGREHLLAYVADQIALADPPLTAQIFLRAADVATKARHPNLAIELLERAIVEAESSWTASQRLAVFYARRSKTKDVERVLNQYIERADDKTEAQIRAGRWAASRRSFDLARFYLEKVVAASDAPPTAWLELARVYSALGETSELERALETYAREALAFHQKAPDAEARKLAQRRALIDVAIIYQSQRMYEAAESSLLKALKKDPEDLLLVRHLEDLYREWGRPKKIIEVYDRWAKARGNKPEDFQTVGERFFRQQEWDTALPYLLRAAKAGVADAWLQVADIYSRQRKERDMKDALQKYLETTNNRAAGLNAVLQRYRVSNWNHEAIPILEELVELEPTNVLHYEQLSQLYFDQGRDVEAFELWKRYIASSNNPIASLETMARRFHRRNHPDWMLQFLHQVLEQEENPDPRIYRLLGDAYTEGANSAQAFTTQANSSAIFTTHNKAKEYYSKYLAEAEPKRGELQAFAESMAQRQYWEIAGQAYEQLKRSSGGLQPRLLLSYGIVLLKQGQAAEAEVVFADYFDQRDGNVEAAVAIADQLYAARRYVAVEPYLRTMLERGDDGLVRQAFMRLGEIYWRSDRTEDIPSLVNEFLERTQNPTEARRTIDLIYDSAGMWDEAARQLESIRDLQGDDVGYGLGVALFRAGRPDDADDAFREFAGSHVNAGEAWRLVAQFWESRGEAERASNAYQNAANSGGTSSEAYADLGRFQILNGKTKAGQQAFERARADVPHAQRGPLYRAEVEALLAVGRYEEARNVATDAATTSFLDRDFFYSVFAQTELQSGDPVRSQRMADQLRDANLPLEQVVEHLYRAGYLEEAAQAIDKEIADGDYLMGGNVLLTYPQIFTRLGGVDRLMRSAQPVLERVGRDAQVPRRLGTFLLGEGHIEEGAMLLRQAVDLGEFGLSPTLAKAYASLGHHEEAFEVMQTGMAKAPTVAHWALTEVGAHYELLGERDRFTQFLEHLARDARFATTAVPWLVAYDVEVGNTAEVIDTVHRLMGEAQVGEQTVSIGDDHRTEVAIAALVAAVENLSMKGFEPEAVALLNAAPKRIAEHEAIRDLRLRVAAFGGTLDGPHEFRTALVGLGTSNSEQRQRLQIAQLAALSGRHELATEIAGPALDSPDFEISARAVRILLKSARIAGNTALLDVFIKKFLSQHMDKASARQVIVSELLTLGLDDRALQFAESQAKKTPTESSVALALIASQNAGDREGLEQWSDRLVQVHKLDPMNYLENQYFLWSLRQDDALNAPLRESLGPLYRQTISGRLLEIQNLYRIGEPFEARDRIADLLKDTNSDPRAVEEILSALEQIRLRGDIARVVAPQVPQTALTNTSRQIIGLANLTLGFNDDGYEMLDKLVESAPDGAVAAAEIADILLARRLYEPALRYAKLAVDRRPGRRLAVGIRGLARIGVGDVEAGRADLETALAAGVGRNELLRRAGTVALRSGNRALAQQLLKDLFVAFPGPRGTVSPTYGALSAFIDAGVPEVGIDFVENFRPSLAVGHGVAGDLMTSWLSPIYEESGQSDRAFAVYEDGIRRLGFTDPFSPDLAKYRNNLAYTFSTTNENVDPGLQLVLEAIANQSQREPNYIDTLGWLLYRQGELAEAEAEIRRAIRSSASGLTDLGELYDHLAAIREARGYHGESVWLRIFADSVRPQLD